VVFAVLGLLLLLKGKPISPWLLTLGLVLLGLGAISPRTLKYIYLGWMGLALVLGFVVSHVILTVFFFLVITPIGLIARLAGKDFLRLKLDRQDKSYWIPREHKRKAAEDYERQF